MERCGFIFLMILGIGGVGLAREHRVRSVLPLESQVLFQDALSSLEVRRWDRGVKTLGMLKPLLTHVNINQTRVLEKLIDERDRKQAVIVLLDIIRQAVLEQLSYRSPPELAQPALRQAFAEFMVLEPYIKRSAPDIAQSLTEQFRRVNEQISQRRMSNTAMFDDLELQLNQVMIKVFKEYR